MAINLDKKLETKVDLVKQVQVARNIPDSTKLEVKTCIDISGSMSNLFANGTVQEVVDRLLAVAVRFDDNASLESYAFGSGAVQLTNVTPADFGGYVDNTFLPQARKSGYLWSGTDYASAMQLIIKDSSGGGFMGFGSKKPKPSYLLFITDGDTSDERSAENRIIELGKKNHYVQLIGIGRGSRFAFLNEMADKYDHVGFVTFPNVEAMSDEQMYNELLSDELATWIRSR